MARRYLHQDHRARCAQRFGGAGPAVRLRHHQARRGRLLLDLGDDRRRQGQVRLDGYLRRCRHRQARCAVRHLRRLSGRRTVARRRQPGGGLHVQPARRYRRPGRLQLLARRRHQRRRRRDRCPDHEHHPDDRRSPGAEGAGEGPGREPLRPGELRVLGRAGGHELAGQRHPGREARQAVRGRAVAVQAGRLPVPPRAGRDRVQRAPCQPDEGRQHGRHRGQAAPGGPRRVRQLVGAGHPGPGRRRGAGEGAAVPGGRLRRGLRDGVEHHDGGPQRRRRRRLLGGSGFGEPADR